MFQDEPVCCACLNFRVLLLGSNGFIVENFDVLVSFGLLSRLLTSNTKSSFPPIDATYPFFGEYFSFSERST